MEIPIHGTYAGGNRMLVHTAYGAPLRAIADDLSLTPELVTTGSYDRPFLNFIARYVGTGQRVVDVGANIGLFTIRMGQLVGPTGEVFAYEAEPEVFEVLVENIELNCQAKWVHAVHAAASATDGAATLHVSTRFRGHSSLSDKTDEYLSGATTGAIEQIAVRSTRLDTALDGAGEIDFVKIDVEGAELEVLEGLAGLIEKGAVRMLDLEVLAELAPDWDGLCARLEALTSEAGASVHLIADDGALTPTTIEHVQQVGRFPHVVLVTPRAS
jgi:FkbM family methyltransferase